MYRHFFDFKKYPFCNTPDTEFFFESENHTEALASLVYVINERKGFAAITGEIGSGKTIVSRKLINNLNSTVEIGLIPNTCIREDNFLKVISEEFHLPTKDRTEVELLSSLNGYLLESLKQNKNVVLIVDEAQNLSVGTLEKIRMLSNLETEKEKLLQIILLGQSELKDLLNSPQTEQIRQRIHVWFHLKSLNEDQAKQYIQYRLKVAGNKGAIFSEQALNQVFSFSKGVPRMINTICDNALLIAFVRGSKKVGQDIVEEVAKDLGYSLEKEESVALPSKPLKPKTFRSSSPILVLSSLIFVFGIFYLLDHEQTFFTLRDKLVSYSSFLKKESRKEVRIEKKRPRIESENEVLRFVSTESDLD